MANPHNLHEVARPSAELNLGQCSATNGWLGLARSIHLSAEGIPMRHSLPTLAAVCLLATLAVPHARAQGSANNEICAADAASAYSPEQRVAACTALIKASEDQPADQVAALVNRG